LFDRVDAPTAVRVEAGYNLGKLLEHRGKLDDAAKVWWSVVDVVQEFVRKQNGSAELGATTPYWLSRTLVDFGDLRQKQGLNDEATAAYKLILEKRLPGEALARARLEQLGVLAPK
jgi:cellulose synthase operon protein C